MCLRAMQYISYVSFSDSTFWSIISHILQLPMPYGALSPPSLPVVAPVRREQSRVRKLISRSLSSSRLSVFSFTAEARLFSEWYLNTFYLLRLPLRRVWTRSIISKMKLRVIFSRLVCVLPTTQYNRLEAPFRHENVFSNFPRLKFL